MVATPVAPAEVEKLFLAWLPEIRSRAWAINHHLPPSEREEVVAEVVAWSWAWMLAGARSHKIERMTPRTLAIFASKAFASGRRFGGSVNTHDAMSERARSTGKVAVTSFDAPRPDGEDSREERGFAILRPLRTPKPYDITRCRLDYGLVANAPELPAKAREAFRHLVADNDRGCFTRIAKDLGVTPPYVHQLKEKLQAKLAGIGYAPSAPAMRGG